MSHYGRSFKDRVWIQCEICYENCLDRLGDYADLLRKPLLFLAGLAVFMTVRSNRKGINTYYNSRNSFSNSYNMNSDSYLRGNSARGGFGGSSSSMRGFGGSSSSTGGNFGMNNFNNRMQGGTSQFGSNAAMNSNQFGGMNQNSAMGMGMGMQQQGMGGGIQQQPGMGMGGGGMTTAVLYSQNGATMQMFQAGFLQNFGGSMSFMGQIETLNAPGSASAVEQVLGTPGQGKVLVVDGGGPSNCGVFDANMVNKARMNGWSGVIINGAVVNGQTLSSQLFGVFASGSAQMRCLNNNGHKGGILAFGNVQFTRGHYVYADKNGIVTSQQEVSNGRFGSGEMQPGTMPTGVGGFPVNSNGLGGMASQQNFQNFGGNNGFNRASGMNTAPQFGGGQFGGGQFGQSNTQPGFGNANSMGRMSNNMSNGMSGRQFSNNFSNRGQSNRNSYYRSNNFNKKKKPSKRTILGSLFLILSVVWCVCMTD